MREAIFFCPYALGAGDATFFDSRLLHCGGANGSERRRVLFYFSFEVGGSENPNSAVSSIRDELRGQYTLADL
jgi:ectoine hydroxylase-related dioxygenase (phytanoyl-CoA dioxygenase family)